MPSFPPRLHVLLERDAPVGLVLRRGPSKAVCAIGWDRKRDRFEVGPWLRGRIYERRSDLSSDGKHVIYFAMNGRWTTSRTKGSWTAVSRAPYLHALALYGKGDCWNGGGLFVDDDTYWLNDGYGHFELQSATEVTRGECPGVYFNRLLRDRLVWATDGKLWAGTITKQSAKRDDPVDRATILHGFTAMTFEAIAAPYARRS